MSHYLPKDQTVNFFDAIAQWVPLKTESRKALLDIMRKEYLPKGTVLVSFSSVCRHVYYVERGLVRSFYLKDGKEITERFCPENSFACSTVDYLTHKSDGRQTELLEDSVIWTMPYTALEMLFDQHHDIERLGRYIASLELMELHRRLDDLQFSSAQDRYRKFMETYPGLLQRVSQRMIASYLGITHETLSRIRTLS